MLPPIIGAVILIGTRACVHERAERACGPTIAECARDCDVNIIIAGRARVQPLCDVFLRTNGSGFGMIVSYI